MKKVITAGAVALASAGAIAGCGGTTTVREIPAAGRAGTSTGRAGRAGRRRLVLRLPGRPGRDLGQRGHQLPVRGKRGIGVGVIGRRGLGHR